jgi:hypothetical protein
MPEIIIVVVIKQSHKNKMREPVSIIEYYEAEVKLNILSGLR